jgi:beta-galactosidase/beta-glucuronidase
MMKYACLLFFCLYLSPFNTIAQVRERIDLAGLWQLRLKDTLFNDKVILPGSLEQNKKGSHVTQPSTQYLNQTYKYTGAAWYTKEIDVPASWKNRPVSLFLERTKVTKVWIDEQLVGSSRLLSAPQVYDCTGKLTPGKHRLTIMVDNSPNLVAVGGSHALSEHTQTNWNGIIGQLYLEATAQVAIQHVRITPDVKNKKADVQLTIRNYQRITGQVILQLSTKQVTINLKGRDTIIKHSYPLGEKAKLWSEYQPALYQLTIRLRNRQQLLDQYTTTFGLREFKAVGTQFRNNGIVTFLRGKNESCVFPLTGYPAMDTASWRKLFRIAKSWGINHYRFHSYTPPEAAFAAADEEGIYIQAELSLWANFHAKDTFMTQFQSDEGKAILDAYGNHPSFVLFTLGNELGGDREVHNKLVSDFRNYDGRRLYAHGTNAFYDNPKPGDTDDFWITMRTGKESPNREYDASLTAMPLLLRVIFHRLSTDGSYPSSPMK